MTISKSEKESRAELIVDTAQGIHGPYEAFYIQQIFSIGKLCFQAFDKFERLAIQKDNAENHIEIFEALQTALTHSAALSRFFWPSRSGIANLHQARGNKLKNAFQLTDDSPIQKRELRNAIEHFDEHLDRFLLEGEMGTHIMLSVSDNTSASDAVGIVLRHINLHKQEVSIVGKSYTYGEMKLEVNRIIELAQEFINQGHVLPGDS